MRPVHQQQMYQVFNPSTRSLISIMSVVSLQICAKVCNHIIGFKMHISSDQLQPTTAGPSKKSQPGGGRSHKVKFFKKTKTIKILITLPDLAVLCVENIIQHRPTWRDTGKPFSDFNAFWIFGRFLAILWFLVGIMLQYVDLILQADSPLTRGQQSKKMSRVQQSKNIVQWKYLSIWCFFRCTFPCLLIPCTCERTALVTSVGSVERSSQDRGCWKDTCGRTPGKSRTGVPSVKSPSPTSQTSEPTFRLTRLQKWEHDSLFYSQTPP